MAAAITAEVSLSRGKIECDRCGRVAARVDLYGCSKDGITVSTIEEVDYWVCRTCFDGPVPVRVGDEHRKESGS